MALHNEIASNVRKLIIQILEYSEEEVTLLNDRSVLVKEPLFLDSVDLLQIYADCERYYDIKLSGKIDYAKSSIFSIAIAISKKLGQVQRHEVNIDFFASRSGASLDIDEFAERAVYVASQSPILSGDKQIFKIVDQNPIHMMHAVIAILLGGHIPLLSATHDGSNTVTWHKLTSSVDSYTPQEKTDSLYSLISDKAKDQLIGFETSGSTGVPEVFYKSITSMWLETTAIAKEIDFSTIDYVNAYVTPVHMYGFIWSFLLPICLNRPVYYQENGPINVNPYIGKKSLSVIVPTIWDLLAERIDSSMSMLVNSASAFGEVREANFLAIAKNKNVSIRGIDILGSTETGGMGYRYFGLESAGIFTLFEPVELTLYPNDKISVKSPFLPQNVEEFYLSDRMDILADRKILHRGRSDKIFKYKGKRFSLDGIEQKLEQFFAGLPKKLFFVDEQSNTKGGRLLVFIESEQEVNYPFTKIKAEFSDLPTPQITVMEKFPLNSLGKVTLKSLLGSI